MSSSKNCSTKGTLAVLFALFVCAGCAARSGTVVEPVTDRQFPVRVAVLPVENLSGAAAPLTEIRAELDAVLASQGFSVLGGEQLEEIMARHRIRYTGGIDGAGAQAFRDDAGMDAVLITSLELYDAGAVPKIAFLSRLVTTSEPPLILWMESIGMSGDDAPGLFNLGMVREPAALLKKAAQALGASLAAHRSGAAAGGDTAAPRPQIIYRSPLVGLNLKECQVSFAQRISRLSEDSGQATLLVALSSITDKTVTVRYDVVGGSARKGIDYALDGETLTFAPGETVKAITVTLKANDVPQDDRIIDLVLGRPENAVLGPVPFHSVLIKDDDPLPVVEFTRDAQRVRESGGTIDLPLRLSHVSGRDIMVPFTMNGPAAAETDYRVLTPSPLVIKAGERKAKITVAVVDDALNEDDEEVVVMLGTPVNALSGRLPHQRVTIADNDPLPAVSFRLAGSGGAEGAGPAALELELNAPSGRPVTVDYAVTGGSAREGKDYRTDGSSAVFAPGETKQTIRIPIRDNSLFQDARTMEVALLKADHAVLGGTTLHTYTIADDDAEPSIAFTQPSQSVREGTVTVTATIKLSVASGRDTIVPFTVTGTAVEGTDYRVVTPSPLRIQPGTEGADIVIIAVDNVARAYDKVLVITLGPPVNAVPGATPVHTIMINDNDGKQLISVLPFFNESGRDNAGEVVMLHFLQRLVQMGAFTVIEPGVVRQKLLQMRVIMYEGISAAETDVLSRSLDADLVLTGRVSDYQEQSGNWGVPKVNLSATLIERESKRIIWAVRSRRTGDDDVLFFDFGKVHTANRLTSEMALVVRDILVR